MLASWVKRIRAEPEAPDPHSHGSWREELDWNRVGFEDSCEQTALFDIVEMRMLASLSFETADYCRGG